MAAADPFAAVEKLDEALIQMMAARFEARGKNPFFRRMLDEYLDAMNLQAARTVLDIGCGTGVVARTITRRSGFSGTVTGVDLSPRLVAIATKISAEEGLSDRVRYRAGDTRSLDIPDGAFDAVVAHTLVSHVENPLAVVKEAARVVRPGGMVAIFDGDYASLTFGNADPVKGKASDEALINAVVTNPRVMRDMPRLLHAAGLELVKSFSHVLAEIGKADFWLSGIEAYRRLVPKAGTMSDDEAGAWAASLRNDSDAGVFFGASNYYSYVAAKRP